MARRVREWARQVRDAVRRWVIAVRVSGIQAGSGKSQESRFKIRACFSLNRDRKRQRGFYFILVRIRARAHGKPASATGASIAREAVRIDAFEDVGALSHLVADGFVLALDRTTCAFLSASADGSSGERDTATHAG